MIWNISQLNKYFIYIPLKTNILFILFVILFILYSFRSFLQETTDFLNTLNKLCI